MDYHRPLNESGDHPKVHIALTLVPGRHSGPKKFSTSPLLLNPGGPGGSGVAIALGWGDHIQNIVGVGQDVIGFDPRGISFTTPPADCYSYPMDTESPDPSWYYDEDYTRGNSHRFLWDISGRETGNAISTTDSLHKLDVRARTVAKLCSEKDAINGKDSILKYVNTPNVARDMLSIVDAWDEWTETLSQDIEDVDLEEEENMASPDGSSHALSTKGKLVYWGFSYGTLLGATFASMFPDRVGRLVLDGVVDADHYVSPLWTGSIGHCDYILSTFSKYCHDAEARCALYRKGDSAADIDARFQSVLNAIKEYPVTLIHPISKAPVVVTYTEIRLILFSTLYSPALMFPIVAQVVDLLHRGRFDVLGQIFSLPYDYDPSCSPVLPSYAFRNEAQPSIMCLDKRYPVSLFLIDS
jgi:pimeloyl-ACP methyl ester carboxylesterase